MWVNGPYPPAKNTDLVISNYLLPQALSPNEKYIADGMYNNGRAIKPDDAEDEYEHWYMARARARHEQVNRLFKRFKVIKNVFRREVSKHGIFTHAIAAIIQIGIQFGVMYVWDLDGMEPPDGW